MKVISWAVFSGGPSSSSGDLAAGSESGANGLFVKGEMQGWGVGGGGGRGRGGHEMGQRRENST